METTTVETAAMKAATGERRCGRDAKQQSRRADDTEAIHAEQSDRRQTVRQAIALARPVMRHLVFSRAGRCSRTGNIYFQQRRFGARVRSSHLAVNRVASEQTVRFGLA
jgi:hypothetical protein